MKTRSLIIVSVLICTVCVYAGMEFTSARIYRDQKEWVKAYDFYSQDLQKNPDNLDGYFERGELLGQLAVDLNKQKARDEIFAGSADPQRSAFEGMMADFGKVRERQDDKKAAKLLKKADDIVSDYWRDYYNLAVAKDSSYSAMIDSGLISIPEDASAELTDSLALDILRDADISILLIPNRWNTFALKAQFYDRLKKIEQSTVEWSNALEALEKQRAEKPKDEDLATAWHIVQLHLLQNHYNLEQYSETLAKANEILEKDSLDLDAIQYKAYAVSQMANDESKSDEERAQLKSEAIRALQQARASNPEDPVICYYIGQFYIQLTDTASALNAFQEYLEIDSTDGDVLGLLGYYYLEGGSFADSKLAEEYFAKLVEYHPEDAAGWVNYGVALIRNGKNVEGAKAIDKGEKLGK